MDNYRQLCPFIIKVLGFYLFG